MRAIQYYPIAQTTPLTLSSESLALITVCALDAILTIFLVASGMAVEANPFMKYFMECGVGVFCLAKMLPLIPLVGLTEWYRKFNPLFVKKAMQFGVVAYTVFYGISVLMVNMS